MSWDGPDRERGPAIQGKPVCLFRPVVSFPDWEAVHQYLEKRNLNPWLAKFNGWYASREAGDTELRVIIPCTSANTRNLYWQGRRLVDTKDKFPLRYTSPRHVSREDALAIVRPQGNVRGTVLVEGPMDALAAADLGYLGIAWMGTDPGSAPMMLARKLIHNGKPIYVVSDTDALAAAVQIWQHFIGAFMISPYPYKDLAEMPKTERVEYFGR